MNREQWMEVFSRQFLALTGGLYAFEIGKSLETAWEEAATYNYSCGFEDGEGQGRNDLDAVLRDLWIEDSDPESEAELGWQSALERVAVHFGLGIDPEEDSE